MRRSTSRPGVSMILLLCVLLPVKRSEAEVNVGDQVIVQVAAAPLHAGEFVSSYAARDTQFEVLRQDRSWLLVRDHGKHVWIHQNHVALPDAPVRLGDKPIPLAALMSAPILTPNDPFLLMQLDQAASSLMACGREQELLDIEKEILETASRLSGPLGAIMRVKLLGVLSGMHLQQGNLELGRRFADSAFNVAQQTIRNIDNGKLTNRQGVDTSALRFTMIHMMAASGWPLANSGELKAGEQKLAAATAALDRALPLSKLREDNTFAVPVDARIYTWHADVLLRLDQIEKARTQIEKAHQCEAAYVRWETHPMTFGRPNSSGYGGYPEVVSALCAAASGAEHDAFQWMQRSQRSQHRYACWSGHIDDATLEFHLRERRGSVAIDNFPHDPFEFAMAHVQHLRQPSLKEIAASAEWVLNRKFQMQMNLQRQQAVIRANQGLGRSRMPDSALMTMGMELGELATNQRLRAVRGQAADYALRRFPRVELDDARREFEAIRYVGSAVRSTRLRELAVVPKDVRRQHWLSVSPSYNPTTKEVESGDPLALRRWHDQRAEELWVTVPKIQGNLESNQVLLEFVRYKDFDFESLGENYRWLQQRYAVWVLPAEGNVVRIDLGDAAAIDAAIAALREGLQAAGDTAGAIVELGEPQATTDVMPLLRQLAALIFEPLKPHIADADQLIISPDAALWLVPWAALPSNENEYLIERYGLQTVTSGRDLARAADIDVVDDDIDDSQISAPVIIADPDFAISCEQVVEAEQDLLGDETIPALLEVAHRGKSLIPKAKRLPYTKAEAQAIAPAIEAYTGIAPRMYQQAAAVEALFQQVERPQVLVLATHAFFLPTLDPMADAAGSRLDIRDPLMRCGLLLAGSDQHDQWQLRRSSDGVLTGYEASSLDLRGTELVVLSACDTGVGDVRGSEGMLGLRQAFQTAGAGAVLASLWQVADRDTAMIMVSFFEHLAAGRSKSDALRHAQLEHIAARRRDSGAAHPFFWAAFTLTGN